MQVTCEISHPFTCEKWCLHVMGHISHENVHCSHVNRMRKTVVRMRKVRMRTACEILTRTDATVVMVVSIVLGRATGAHDGVPHCYTA